MPSHKVRVIPRFPCTGLLVLCAAAGLIHGICGSWLTVLFRDAVRFGTMSSGGMLSVLLVVVVIFILPAVAFAMLINRVHPHLGRLLVCALLYGPGAFAGMLAVLAARNPGWILFGAGTSNLFERLLAFAFVFAAGAGFAGMFVLAATLAAFALGFAIEHTVGRRVILQSGSICWSCGYDLGVRGPGTCPECGRAFNPDDRFRAASPRILGGFIRFRWRAIALFSVIAITPIIYDLATYSLPAIRFLQARPPNTPLKDSTMVGTWIWRSSGLGSSNFVRAISDGWWLADSTSPTTGIIVQFFPSSRDDEPRIVVSRAYLRDVNASGPPSDPQSLRWVAGGTFNVLARLSPEQAEAVIQSRSLPKGLLNELRGRAEATGWQPGQPTQGTRQQDEAIDPSPYFPTAPSR